jgi:hypothetical protein
MLRANHALSPGLCSAFVEQIVSIRAQPQLPAKNIHTLKAQGCASFPALRLFVCVAYIKLVIPPPTTMVSSQAHGSTTLNTAKSFTSSTRPIIDNRISTDQHTTATMSGINGKAPVNGAGAPPLDAPLIKVQPPRREDLQPSYAQVIKPDDADADTNGWYGSMVCSCPKFGPTPI